MKKFFTAVLIIYASILYAQQKTIEQRVDSVLTLMTLDEKIGQLNQYSGGWETGARTDDGVRDREELVRTGKVGSFLNVIGADLTRKIQKIAVEQSRLKIPIIFGLDVIHGFRSTFPVPIAEASSWNPKLVETSTRWQATEAASAGVHWTFAPMVDIARDPRWGRIVEGSGEDPYLGSVMAAAAVKGFQGNDLSANNTIAACAKHFAGYGAAEGGRDYNTADFSERTFHEVYLRPFKAAVDAGVATLMCSFNEIGGVPSSANYELLTKILRDDWKFKGFVVSDWNSIGELIPHGVAKDLKQAAELGIKAGVDMDMESNAYIRNLKTLVEEKKVSVQNIDESVRRILRVKFELGLFDDPYKYCDEKREKETEFSKKIVEATCKVAHESIVLLKNEKNILPLSKEIKSVAVIGPLANSHEDPLGPWSGVSDSTHVITVLDGVKSKLGASANILYSQGCTITGTSVDGFKSAVESAQKADAVILCLGESLNMSGEASARASLDLPGVQEKLAEEIFKTGKPVVVVLMNGRPLTINWISENIPAVVETWFLGIQSGNAIADVLFGDYNPNGKLPVTFPRSVGQVPIYYNHKNTGRPYNPNDHYTSYYLDLQNTPLYPFGYGLSYSKFEYSNLSLSSNKIKNGEPLKVKVDVKNVSSREGEEVVQLYVQDLVGSVTRPVKELKDFSKVDLKPGETKTVEFTITPDKLKFYDINMNFTVEPGDFKVFVGTNSVDLLESTFSID